MSSTNNTDEQLTDWQPDQQLPAKTLFDIPCNWQVPAFQKRSVYVPTLDNNYHFNSEVTQTILAGFKYNRRVLIQGMHGTGKSTHVEQVAARLNWPCLRVNLDGHISRLDLVGKDVVTLQEGKQVTAFQEGIVPWALQRPIALIFDEYDAGRPDVMFVIQRLLERDGHFTLPDQHKVLKPHPAFRLFATANTIGLGNLTGLYHGAQRLNQAQLDRWNMIVALNYLPLEEEVKIIQAQVPEANPEQLTRMVQLATLTRQGFQTGDLSTLMSPRTVISWAENGLIMGELALAFRLSFLNKCEDAEKPLVGEFYQRCFGEEL